MSGQPHDALFKAVFSQTEHAAGLLAAVMPAAFGDHVDWSTLALCPGTFIDARLAERRSDLLFSVLTEGGETALVYVLLEHQSEPDRWMALRLHGYVHRIWEQWLRERREGGRLPAVLPIVVHHGASGWTAATSLSELYDLDGDVLELLRPHLPELRFVLDDLGRVPVDRLEARPMTDLGRLALLLLQRVRVSPDLVADVRRWMGMFGRVLRGTAGREAFELLMQYVSSVLDVVPEGLPAALEEGLGSEAREAYMSAAQKLIDQGRAEGQAEMLLRVIAARFGAAPANVETRVRTASTEQLGRWGERVLTAASLTDLFGDD